MGSGGSWAGTLLSQPRLLPAHAAPPLSALRGYAGMYAAQVCGAAASTRSARAGIARAGSGTSPPAQPLPERPPSPGTVQKPTFQALKLLFKSNSDKDLFSLNMTGCWPRGDFGSGAGGSWPQISGALTGAGGDAEPLQGDHRAKPAARSR